MDVVRLGVARGSITETEIRDTEAEAAPGIGKLAHQGSWLRCVALLDMLNVATPVVEVELLGRVIVVAAVATKRSRRHEAVRGQRRVTRRWFAAEAMVLFWHGKWACVRRRCRWRGLGATRLGEVEIGRVAGGQRRAAATEVDGGMAVGVIGWLVVAWVLISSCRGCRDVVARCLAIIVEGKAGGGLRSRETGALPWCIHG